ncbi:hypothetical protein K438DRAFT_1864513 [Mycena galopus ATCC 62051]|nr:hypothetical protein K438DRAFT_1864513 [Mycena galopus ATCC 62051]
MGIWDRGNDIVLLHMSHTLWWRGGSGELAGTARWRRSDSEGGGGCRSQVSCNGGASCGLRVSPSGGASHRSWVSRGRGASHRSRVSHNGVSRNGGASGGREHCAAAGHHGGRVHCLPAGSGTAGQEGCPPGLDKDRHTTVLMEDEVESKCCNLRDCDHPQAACQRG